LKTRILLEISHGDGGVNWIIVSAYVLVREANLWKYVLILFDCRGVVENLSWQHFETIGVGPEFTLWVETIKHLEVNSDIFTLVILDWNGIQFNVELNESLQMLREQDLDECALLVALVVSDGPLFNLVTLLIHDVGVDLTELLWKWCLEFGQEDEAAFGSFQLKPEFRSLELLSLLGMINIENLMCKILLEVDSKHLGEVLLLVSVLEEDLRLIINTLDLKGSHVLFLLLHFFFLFFFFWRLESGVFEDFDDEDLIWLNYSLKEHLIIGELLSILLPVLLFENVGFNINK
jgi:hypothetical protein